MPNTGMLVSMKPTSISHSGTSASVNNNGGVDFTTVTSLSLNGVFTGDYDNYLIVTDHIGTSNAEAEFKLRASGTDSTTGYTRQDLLGFSTTLAAGRVSNANTLRVAAAYSGYAIHVYGPALAQPTAWRSVSAYGRDGAFIADFAVTHSTASSYDGFTIIPGIGSLTGTIHVFGYRE